MSEAGFAVGFVEEEHMWTAPDGSGRNRRKTLGVQYANEESRRYWEGRPAAERQPFLPDQVDDIPVGGGTYGSPPGPDATRPPANRADLARMLNARYGAIDAAKWTMELYRSYVVPRSVRAQVLLILADLDGFVWRGAATDRAGRRGVAISALWTPGPDEGDQNRYEWGLLFDPRTGELLVLEVSILTPHRRPFEYDLILAPGWTDQLG